MRLVAWLISIASSDNFKLYITLFHGSNQLILELVNILHVGLDNSNARLSRLDHIQDVLADVCAVWWLLLH